MSRPPGPRGLPLVGSTPAFAADILGFLEETFRTHGDLASVRLGRDTVYILAHPDFVRDVWIAQHQKLVRGPVFVAARRVLGQGLLTSDPPLHRRQRKLVQPAFHRQRIEAFAQAMVACAEAMDARWQPGARVDMAAEMYRLTLAVIGQALFGLDLEHDAGPVKQALHGIQANYGTAMRGAPDWVLDLPLPRNRRLRQARRFFDQTIYQLIRERRAAGEERDDMLAMLLAAADEEGGMTDEQVRDEAITLFLAGHDTTAAALTWTWRLLAANPHEADPMFEEIDRVLGGRLPTLADVPALPYTRMAFTEAMRRYPPAWSLGRRIAEPVQAGPYTLEPGARILLPQWLVHRDPRWFPNPHRFDPTRWTPEASASRPKHAYFPFGAGPRLCIGEQFTWMEAVLVLATLGRRWRPVLDGKPDDALDVGIVLRPRHGLPMVLAQRRYNPLECTSSGSRT